MSLEVFQRAADDSIRVTTSVSPAPKKVEQALGAPGQRAARATMAFRHTNYSQPAAFSCSALGSPAILIEGRYPATRKARSNETPGCHA